MALFKATVSYWVINSASAKEKKLRLHGWKWKPRHQLGSSEMEDERYQSSKIYPKVADQPVITKYIRKETEYYKRGNEGEKVLIAK